MSKIAVEREVIEQALEALEWLTAAEPGDEPPISAAITALRQALEQPQQPIPQGWKLVPVEMTNAMGLAGQRERKTFGSSLASVYRAMLAAAPEA